MILIWLSCATPKVTDTAPVPKTIQDYDEDGFDNEVDCNDIDPEIHPQATEICDQRRLVVTG